MCATGEADTLESAAERKNGLLFGNQTLIRLRYLAEVRRLGKRLPGHTDRDRMVVLSYRPGIEEPGPEKSFALSAPVLAQRW